MAKMRAVQVARAGGALEVVERDVTEPKRGEIPIRVQACDVYHSDSFTVEGVIGVDAKSIEVSPLQLMSASRSIVGARRRRFDRFTGHVRFQFAVWRRSNHRDN